MTPIDVTYKQAQYKKLFDAEESKLACQSTYYRDALKVSHVQKDRIAVVEGQVGSTASD